MMRSMDTIAGRGRSEAFVGLIEGRLVAAYRLARAILLDDQEAEDAVQDACLVAWQQRGSLRDPTRFGAWFDRIVLNGCRDRLRTRQRQRVRTIALEGAVGVASVQSGDDPELFEALAGLDLDHRLVVVLRFQQDLTLNEIAHRLDLPLGTVKSRLHYALRTLRSHLEADDGRA